jgi:hypothetical protein
MMYSMMLIVTMMMMILFYCNLIVNLVSTSCTSQSHEMCASFVVADSGRAIFLLSEIDSLPIMIESYSSCSAIFL